MGLRDPETSSMSGPGGPPGSWPIREPLGFIAGDANLYRYVGNNPTNATDPTGLSAVSATTVALIAKTHGAIELRSRWKLDRPPEKDGLIYQKVKVRAFAEDANGQEINENIFFLVQVRNEEYNALWYPYQEVWSVTAGNVHTDLYERNKATRDYDDFVTTMPYAKEGMTKTKGTILIELDAVFVEGTKMTPPDFKVRMRGPNMFLAPAGLLPVRLNDPKNPMLNDKLPAGTKVLERRYQIEWDAVTGDGKTKITVNSDPTIPNNTVITPDKPWKP